MDISCNSWAIPSFAHRIRSNPMMAGLGLRRATTRPETSPAEPLAGLNGFDWPELPCSGLVGCRLRLGCPSRLGRPIRQGIELGCTVGVHTEVGPGAPESGCGLGAAKNAEVTVEFLDELGERVRLVG